MKTRREVLAGLLASAAAGPVIAKAAADGIALTSTAHPVNPFVAACAETGCWSCTQDLNEKNLLRMMMEVRDEFLTQPWPRFVKIVYEDEKIVCKEIPAEQVFYVGDGIYEVNP